MKFVTAGESHGPALTAIVSGVPAGIHLDEDIINCDMARRQKGYGRGGRMKIETDRAEILSGVRFSKTLGSPVTLQIVNADHANWKGRMDVFGEAPDDLVREVQPRPGHADLVGMFKTDTDDARNILERSSARETAARVAAGAIAKAFLREMGVTVFSYVKRIGDVLMDGTCEFSIADIEQSECRCPDAKATEAMKAAIDAAKEAGESLGGEVIIMPTGWCRGWAPMPQAPSV